jgi:hypothetical protein
VQIFYVRYIVSLILKTHHESLFECEIGKEDVVLKDVADFGTPEAFAELLPIEANVTGFQASPLQSS